MSRREKQSKTDKQQAWPNDATFWFSDTCAIFCTNCGNVEVLLMKQFLTLLYCTQYHWFHSFSPSFLHSFIRSVHSSLCRSISLNAVKFMYTWESHDTSSIQSALSSLTDWPISTHDTWWPFTLRWPWDLTSGVWMSSFEVVQGFYYFFCKNKRKKKHFSLFVIT